VRIKRRVKQKQQKQKGGTAARVGAHEKITG
jgi:hypothetical protein